MQLLGPVMANPNAPLPRANPLAKVGAATLVMVALFVSLDGVTAAIILSVLGALLAASGLRIRSLAGRAWLLGLAALSIAIFNVALAAEQLGPPLAVGPAQLGTDTLVAGVGLALRLLGIALAGILAVATTDPTDLADALVQQLRVPARFAIGALAALRLAPLLGREWQTIAMARRARGVDAGGNPFVAVRLFNSQLLSLLVGAIRRGSRMALAMDGRGFGAGSCRTTARVPHMRPGDWAWIAGGAALAIAAVAISIALGTWRPLFG